MNTNLHPRAWETEDRCCGLVIRQPRYPSHEPQRVVGTRVCVRHAVHGGKRLVAVDKSKADTPQASCEVQRAADLLVVVPLRMLTCGADGRRLVCCASAGSLDHILTHCHYMYRCC